MRDLGTIPNLRMVDRRVATGEPDASAAPGPCLSITDLQISIAGATPVEDVSLAVRPGSVHCLVGDSGSGKTLTSLAAIGLLPAAAKAAGSLRLAGVTEDLLELDQRRWSSIRGCRISYVGQNALGCLHPAFRVEAQLVEAIRHHQGLSRSEAKALAVEELAAVDLRDPARVARSYPAELSGGMCQRVAIAIALCNRPSVLIADEPTTSLDDETQRRILDLIGSRVDRDGLGVLLITHDQAVVEEVADDVTVIAAGVSSVSSRPAISQDVSTRATNASSASSPGAPALRISGVAKSYRTRGRRRSEPNNVLHDVSLEAQPGTTVGLVGRSGAGKTTLAQIVAGVLEPSEGSVHIAGEPITGSDRVDRKRRADLVQYVFQNPFGSLNPRRTPVAQVAEPLVAAGEAAESAQDRARTLLREVGLTDQQISRLPTTLSGGQCQRVGIARALIRRPPVIVLDEPVSALDWSIRDEIMDILAQQQSETEALYLLISHERALVERESDEIYQVVDGAVIRV